MGTLTGAPEPTSAQGRSVRRRVPPMVHAVRLLILGVGVGAIAGTFLSIFNPASQSTADISQMTLQGSIANPAKGESPPMLSRLLPGGSHSATLQRSQELGALRSTLQSLLTQNPHLTAGISLVDLDTGAYVDLNATTSLPAASTIKVPVLVAFLQAVDAGTLRLDEMLTMEAADVAEGSGEMQYQAVGTQYSALETAEMMITISDNTATNMLIRRLGGAVVLNQRFQSWGMRQTVLNNPLADLDGTNTTSSQDLTNLLMVISQGELLSLRSRDRLMEIMQGTVADSLIPAGVGDQRAVIAHKTGTLDHMVGDTGIVDMPNGKRFIVTVLVQRPIDDESAPELIRQVCTTVYQYLGQSAVLTPTPQ
ncbi:MAG: serine hydrolase [Leptolyngbyaceae cyanobacterium SL_7_1]|nr:serine hydrolase [Leptolyngbyaceae cyanobacterium SL_7_1]